MCVCRQIRKYSSTQSQRVCSESPFLKHIVLGCCSPPEGRAAGSLCEVATQREGTRDRLIATTTWPLFLEHSAHTGVGLRWARGEETWQASRTEEERTGWWVMERVGVRGDRQEQEKAERNEGGTGGMI